jgi:hypothetical protein
MKNRTDIVKSSACVVQVHRCRKTKTIVQMCRAEDAGMFSDDGPWVTICVDHGGIVHHPTLKLARSWAADPAGWCPDCQKMEYLHE